MRSGEYIQKRFQAWARRQNHIEGLQGSQGERGEPNYTLTLQENLFQPLSDDTRSDYEEGAGRELRGNPCSMQALHSSATMTTNLFDYLRTKNISDKAARILRIPSRGIKSMRFERKYPVIDNPENHGLGEPHLNVAFDYDSGCRVGVECKLFEPFGRLEQAGLRDAYLELPEAWDDIPACRRLAQKLAEGSAGFTRLAPAQLVKHLLGLKNSLKIHQFRLVYLYYDAPGDEAAAHRAEIRRFAELIADDGINLQPLSVQEFILRAATVLDDEHTRYINYLSERYL